MVTNVADGVGKVVAKEVDAAIYFIEFFNKLLARRAPRLSSTKSSNR
jgi:hypothetical protein